MSDIQRYGQDLDFEDYPVGSCYPQPNGDFVRYTDHLAEVRRIYDAVTRLLAPVSDEEWFKYASRRSTEYSYMDVVLPSGIDRMLQDRAAGLEGS